LDLAGNIVVDKGRQENQPGKRDKPPFLLTVPKAENNKISESLSAVTGYGIDLQYTD
jgi:hypothetical protein